MSLKLNTRFNEMKENNPSSRDTQSSKKAMILDDVYPSPGSVRNLCYELSDGRKMFLNYAYLISAELATENDKMMITYTTHTVLITGINLEPLFINLMANMPQLIRHTESRYATQYKGEKYLPHGRLL